MLSVKLELPFILWGEILFVISWTGFWTEIALLMLLLDLVRVNIVTLIDNKHVVWRKKHCEQAPRIGKNSSYLENGLE